LRVGRRSARGFAGVPLVTGVRHGFFRAQGLDLELAVFGGGHTSLAMTAGAVDISVQSEPRWRSWPRASPGRRWRRSIGVTGPSLTGWLVQALSRQQGFGPNGIKMNYAQPASSWALMKTRAIDGMVVDLGTALQAERSGDARILVNFGKILEDFHVFVAVAHSDVSSRSFVELDYLPKEPDMTALYTER
jgi:ABC-type nitrate/sulfonate/bicarbonate transport system substrate-binding protein